MRRARAAARLHAFQELRRRVPGGANDVKQARRAGGLQGWFIEKTKIFERVIMVVSGVALAYPSSEADLIGFIGFGLVLITQTLTHLKLSRKPS